MKTCTLCGETKPLADFYPHLREGSTRPDCKLCCRARNAKWKRTNANRHSANVSSWTRKNRFRKYGMTREEYQAMWDGQGGICPICHETLSKPNIDHCHRTGKVRGILCGGCNSGLGMFKDNTARLANAIVYLLKGKP